LFLFVIDVADNCNSIEVFIEFHFSAGICIAHLESSRRNIFPWLHAHALETTEGHATEGSTYVLEKECKVQDYDLATQTPYSCKGVEKIRKPEHDLEEQDYYYIDHHEANDSSFGRLGIWASKHEEIDHQ